MKQSDNLQTQYSQNISETDQMEVNLNGYNYQYYLLTNTSYRIAVQSLTNLNVISLEFRI